MKKLVRNDNYTMLHKSTRLLLIEDFHGVVFTIPCFMLYQNYSSEGPSPQSFHDFEVVQLGIALKKQQIDELK